MTDLEQRLADTLDELNGAAERADWAESELAALRDRQTERSQTPPEDDDAAAGQPQDLLRQLQEARQANQRLSDLLTVFGVSKGAAPGRALERLEPASNPAAPASASQ